MSIREEIQEMFSEYSEMPLDSPLTKNIAFQIVKEMKLGKYESYGLYRKSFGGALLRIEEGALIRAFGRFKVFYNNSGKTHCAYELLKTGEYSGREVARICEMSINTIRKIYDLDKNLKCICGRILKTHRGWCNYRFSRSNKRQKTIAKMKRKGQQKNVES